MASVGLVLVSHSEKVTDGVKELLKQVVEGVPIETAGGNDEGGIGTSFDKIQTALENIEAEETLIFYDLGSAKMNAEMALEAREADNIQLASYPIVEGSYIAAVEASMNKSGKDILSSLEKEFGRK